MFCHFISVNLPRIISCRDHWPARVKPEHHWLAAEMSQHGVGVWNAAPFISMSRCLAVLFCIFYLCDAKYITPSPGNHTAMLTLTSTSISTSGDLYATCSSNTTVSSGENLSTSLIKMEKRFNVVILDDKAWRYRTTVTHSYFKIINMSQVSILDEYTNRKRWNEFTKELIIMSVPLSHIYNKHSDAKAHHQTRHIARFSCLLQNSGSFMAWVQSFKRCRFKKISS